MKRAPACSLLIAVSFSVASGQAINDWLQQQVSDTAVMTAAQKKPTQTQSTSLNQGSTTFVDQTSAPDLIGAALNLGPLGNSQTGSGTVTASLYSVYALASGLDPLKTSVFNAHSGMRTLFVTLGREEPGSSTTSTGATAVPPGTIYGVRWLPVNQRDASAIANNRAAMDSFRKAASAIGSATAEAASELSNLLRTHLHPQPGVGEFLESIRTTADVQAKVDQLESDPDPAIRAEVTAAVKALVARYRTKMAGAEAALQDTVKGLSRRWQVAIDFQTTQRSGTANNDYQMEVIADRAIKDRFFFTFNGSYLYSDSSKIGADLRTGRGAFELQYNVTQAGATSLRSPLNLSLSGEGLYKQQTWQYHAQLQLVIPISTGVNLPLSFGYGNRTDLLRQEEKDVYGKFGLTFDLSKIVTALRASQ